MIKFCHAATYYPRLARHGKHAQLYTKIKRLWLKHSRAEDKRDLDGLISTLAPDCVYEVFPTGQRWEGHDGARTFYTAFLGAFPDVHFDATDVVIGPQGVVEVARVTGTHLGEWAGMKPTGRTFTWQIIIHFPWNPIYQKFAGENVYYDGLAMQKSLG